MDSLVLVPFVPGMLRPETVCEVARQAPRWELAPIDPGDDRGYAKLLRKHWRRPGHLIVCEQDVVPPSGAIRHLLECRHFWCSHPHRLRVGLYTASLGLTRFHEGLRWRNPELADTALARAHWRHCDARLASALRAIYVELHVHEPATIHLHAYS